MKAQVRFKLGQMEVRVSGTESFVVSHLERVIDAAAHLGKTWVGDAGGTPDSLPVSRESGPVATPPAAPAATPTTAPVAAPAAALDRRAPAPAAKPPAKPGAGSSARSAAARPAAGTRIDIGLLAGKLEERSGRNLALAAIAHLAFVEARPSFRRREIHDLMSHAAGFYRPGYRSSLTKLMRDLVEAGFVRRLGSGAYGLESGSVERLKAMFGVESPSVPAPEPAETRPAKKRAAARSPKRPGPRKAVKTGA